MKIKSIKKLTDTTHHIKPDTTRKRFMFNVKKIKVFPSLIFHDVYVYGLNSPYLMFTETCSFMLKVGRSSNEW